MTQNTQTTVERLLALIANNQQTIRTGSIKLIDHGRAANLIAAEIERLTAEVASKQETIDMLLEDERDAFRHERAQLETQLAKARAEVARREADLSTARITITEVESERNGANAFLDEVAFILQMPTAYMGGVNGWAEVKMQGLAEARAEVESCRKAYAQMRSTEDEWKRDTLAALKAEVERLRPAAEAWEALQAAYHPGRGSSLEYAYSVACFERAGVLRARKAAKEGKP